MGLLKRQQLFTERLEIKLQFMKRNIILVIQLQISILEKGCLPEARQVNVVLLI